MFGSQGAWYYTSLAGLQRAAPGSCSDVHYAAQQEKSARKPPQPLEGRLHKLQPQGIKYQERTFRLEGGLMAYVGGDGESRAIDLRQVTKVEVRDAETLCFAVVTPERDYVFRARDSPSFNRWVAAITEHCGYLKAQQVGRPTNARRMSGITVGADGAFNMTNVPEEMRAAMGASLDDASVWTSRGRCTQLRFLYLVLVLRDEFASATYYALIDDDA